MRITNKMTSNRYLTNLNRSFEEMTKLHERATNGRSYQKGSEDPSSALKAYQVRQNLSRIDLYKKNIGELEGRNNETESTVSAINRVLGDVMEQVQQGRNDTFNESQRASIGEVIRSYQAQIFNLGNTRFSGRYIFGGSDMSKPPFTLSGGELLYQGKDVMDNDFTFDDQSSYYDIGMGLSVDASGKIVEGTALDVSNPGSLVLGTGTDSDGLPNNIYSLLGVIATAFESNDMSNIDALLGKLEKVTDHNMTTYVNLGQRSNFIEFLKARFETDEANAMARRKMLETVDTARAIIDFNTQDLAYQAALQMGTKLLRQSLLDYFT